MKKMMHIFILILFVVLLNNSLFAGDFKKVGQSGMTYLSISLGARESAMGNASTASVKGIQGVFYNPAVLTEFEGFSFMANQVNWLADTKVYGIVAGYGFGQYGSFAIDMIYMDYGDIMGTEVVDKSVNEAGYQLTGLLNVKDYSIGLSYAYPVNDRFTFGGKIKYVYEYLGKMPIVTGYKDSQQTEYAYSDPRDWAINHWGIDFGAYYKTAFKDLALGVAFVNYSTDMRYWQEAFAMPLSLKMGMSMDIATLFMEENKKFKINMAVDAIHPVDYSERVHIGTEIVYRDIFSLRGGYQFNHDVENWSMGFGVRFDYQGLGGSIDYSYTNADYFDNVNRFTIQFWF